MIASALRAEIGRYAIQARRTSPLFTKAEDGTLTGSSVRRYLANVHHLIRHTPIYLARARDRAFARGDARLAEHYEHKLREEDGHEVWAERDIACLSEQLSVPAAGPEVVPALRALVDYLGTIIDEEPSLYLGYILFAEHLTVLLGPDWLRLLEDNCGIPRSSMSVVANHVELDREHVEEALDCIDDLVGDPRKLARMREVLLESMTHFDRFCTEVTDSKEAHDSRPSRSTTEHVSAA